MSHTELLKKSRFTDVSKKALNTRYHRRKQKKINIEEERPERAEYRLFLKRIVEITVIEKSLPIREGVEDMFRTELIKKSRFSTIN